MKLLYLVPSLLVAFASCTMAAETCQYQLISIRKMAATVSVGTQNFVCSYSSARSSNEEWIYSCSKYPNTRDPEHGKLTYKVNRASEDKSAIFTYEDVDHKSGESMACQGI